MTYYSTNLMAWKQAQDEIANCCECLHKWPNELINPLEIGEIPDPPEHVKILFVGVAPTPKERKNKGGHFYTTPSDPLRRALLSFFKDESGVLFKDFELTKGTRKFIEKGMFFVHTSKARPITKLSPHLNALYFCSQRHLAKELEVLRPKVVCFLGKSTLQNIARKLFGIKIGQEPVTVSIGSWTGLVLVSPQPLRAGKKEAVPLLKKLLQMENENLSWNPEETQDKS